MPRYKKGRPKIFFIIPSYIKHTFMSFEIPNIYVNNIIINTNEIL